MTAEFSIGVQDTAKARDEAATAIVGGLGRALVALLLLAAAVLVWRRLAGALAQPLAAAELCLAATVLAATAAAARRTAQDLRATLRRELLLRATVSLAVLSCGAALTMPRGGSAALVVFWAVLVGGESWAWRRFFTPGLHKHASIPATAEPVVVSEIPLPAEEAAAEVLQQLTLSRTAGGAQRLSGWLRMPVVAGQRQGNLHVAFCPPFDRPPQIVVEACDGPACQVKPTQVLPYGVRLEVKLAAMAPCADSVLLRFAAETIAD